MHDKAENSPTCFDRANIAGFLVLSDFVLVNLLRTPMRARSVGTRGPTNLHDDLVMTLIHVLVQVLDGLDGGANLHVYVAIVLLRKKRIVRDDVTIVELALAFTSRWHSTTIVPPPVLGEALGGGVRLFAKNSWELFATHAGTSVVLHAR